MRNLYQVLSLFLLLLIAQQGAVVHKLSHLAGADTKDIHVHVGGRADTHCGLCPAFAQATAPAFAHTFHMPVLVRTALQLIPEPQFAGADAAVPPPRSRGPPSLS